MADTIPTADHCTSMAEVRAAIDDCDRRIVTLLAARMRYIEAAARIKQDRDAVRDEARKAEVIDHAAAVAAEAGFPPALVRAIYDLLVEGSIAHEFATFDAR
jgi:isochorismate pyruvate lyase